MLHLYPRGMAWDYGGRVAVEQSQYLKKIYHETLITEKQEWKGKEEA